MRSAVSFALMLAAAMALTYCTADILQRVQRRADIPAPGKDTFLTSSSRR